MRVCGHIRGVVVVEEVGIQRPAEQCDRAKNRLARQSRRFDRLKALSRVEGQPKVAPVCDRRFASRRLALLCCPASPMPPQNRRVPRRSEPTVIQGAPPGCERPRPGAPPVTGRLGTTRPYFGQADSHDARIRSHVRLNSSFTLRRAGSASYQAIDFRGAAAEGDAADEVRAPAA